MAPSPWPRELYGPSTRIKPEPYPLGNVVARKRSVHPSAGHSKRASFSPHHANSELAQCRRTHTLSFVSPLARAASIAASTLGGDIGSSVNRMPVASSTALAMAAIGGTIGVSPTPRTP